NIFRVIKKGLGLIDKGLKGVAGFFAGSLVRVVLVKLCEPTNELEGAKTRVYSMCNTPVLHFLKIFCGEGRNAVLPYFEINGDTSDQSNLAFRGLWLLRGGGTSCRTRFGGSGRTGRGRRGVGCAPCLLVEHQKVFDAIDNPTFLFFFFRFHIIGEGLCLALNPTLGNLGDSIGRVELQCELGSDFTLVAAPLLRELLSRGSNVLGLDKVDEAVLGVEIAWRRRDGVY